MSTKPGQPQLFAQVVAYLALGIVSGPSPERTHFSDAGNGMDTGASRTACEARFGIGAEKQALPGKLQNGPSVTKSETLSKKPTLEQICSRSAECLWKNGASI